jgi:hypothetical protein
MSTDPHPDHPIVLPVAWLPTPQQVADLLRARTKDDQSNEIGAWTANTRPTEYEVAGLIQTAAGDLLAAVPALTPEYPDPERAAQTLCSYGAACLVELSYFPEQVASQRGISQSAYTEYRAMWEAGVKTLNSALAGPPSGASTYAVQLRSSTLAAAYGGLLWPQEYAPLVQPWQGAINLPEPETAGPTVPTDPVYVPYGPEVPDA